MSNLPGQMFRPDESGTWTLGLPIEEDAQIPLIDIEADTGKYVKAIFNNRDKLLGKEVYGSGKYYTPLEIGEEFKKVYPGTEAKFFSVPKDDYTLGMTSMCFPKRIADELLENMILLNKEYGYYVGADLGDSNSVSTATILGNQRGRQQLMIIDT